MSKHLFYSTTLLLHLLGQSATAQQLDPAFAPPASLYAPGFVYALGPSQADGKRLVAGAFTRVNGVANAGQLLRLNAAGVPEADFGQHVGAASGIRRIKGLPNGQYLLGSAGGAVAAGGLARTELLRLNADGTADTGFDAGIGPRLGNIPGYGQDYLPVADGGVLVTGRFDSFSGVTAGGIVRLGADGRVDQRFAVGPGIDFSSATFNYGSTLALQADGHILLGGTFSTFSGQPAYGLVRLGSTGSPDPAFGRVLAAGSRVFSIVVQPDGKILLEGQLTTSAGSTGLLRLQPDGSLDTSFAPQLTGLYISSLDPLLALQPDGKLLIVTRSDLTKTNYLTRLNTDGSFDTSFSFPAGFNGSPYTLGVQADGSVLVGGSFGFFGSTENPLVHLTASGNLAPGSVPQLQVPGNVMAVVRQADGQLLLGGTFTEYNGVAVHRLVRVSAAGVLDTKFAAATGLLPGLVSSLAAQADGKLVTGTGAGVVRLLGTGQPDSDFTPFASYGVTGVAVQADGRIVAGGYIYAANGLYNGLVRLLPNGAPDPTFARQSAAGLGPATSTDALLLQPDGRIVASGHFAASGQPSTCRVVRYESSGAVDATFNPVTFSGSGTGAATPYVYALAQQPDGRLLAGGNFGQVNGSVQYGVARVGSRGEPDPTFNPSTPLGGTVYSLAVQPKGRVLLGGSFAGPTPYLSRVLADGAADNSFGATAAPNGTVRALLVQPDGAVVTGGYFTTIGGQPAVGAARLLAPNVLAVAAPAATTAHLGAWPVPAHGLLHVAAEAGAQQAELLDALGRRVRWQALGGAGEFTLATEGLPAGVYVLRVQYAEGSVSRQVAVE